MAVPNEQYDELREQLLQKSTCPSLSQVGAAKICVRQDKLLRVIQDRAMEMHDAFEVIAQRQRRSPVNFRRGSEDALCGTPKVIVIGLEGMDRIIERDREKVSVFRAARSDARMTHFHSLANTRTMLTV